MTERPPLSYVALALFSAAVAVTSKDYFFPQIQSINVACSKFASNIVANTTYYDDVDSSGAVKSTSIKNEILNTEQWDQIKHHSCPNMMPNPSIWPILFEQSRIELGLDLGAVPHTAEDQDWMENFFTFSSGGVGYTSLDEENYFVYLKVWKSANDFIRKNIKQRAQKSDNFWEFDVKVTSYHMKSGYRDYSELWSPIPLSKLNETCVVTAVRDPVEHFLSGYNEIEFRSTDSWRKEYGITKTKESYYERYENGTDTRFERYVAEFIWGASAADLYPTNPFSNILHSCSQTGVLWHLKGLSEVMGVNAPQLTAYLPSISNVSAAFPNLVATNCPGFEVEFSGQFGKEYNHASQKDELGFYTAAKRVWRKQDATARALCALHLMDYACFDLIPIPDLCQEVFSDSSFADRLLTQAAASTTQSTSEPCTFCEGGVLDSDLVDDQADGHTCGSIKSIAATEEKGSAGCEIILQEEAFCCPTMEQAVEDGDA